MSEALAVIESESSLVPRHEQVLDEIKFLKMDIMARVLHLGKLLVEVDDEQHYLKYGYPSAKAWLLNGSGLDLSERDAFYMKRVIRRSRELGIPDDDLMKVKFSKLKRICALNDDEATPEEIKELIQSAETRSLKDITDEVNVIKKLDFEFRTMKWDRDTFDNVIEPGFERIRREYGGTIDEEGNEQDITDSKCVEMALANYLSQAEEQDDDVIEGEYVDTVYEEAEEEQA